MRGSGAGRPSADVPPRVNPQPVVLKRTRMRKTVFLYGIMDFLVAFRRRPERRWFGEELFESQYIFQHRISEIMLREASCANAYGEDVQGSFQNATRGRPFSLIFATGPADGDRGFGHAEFRSERGTESALRWKLDVERAGRYRIRFHYSNGDGSRGPLALLLDGRVIMTDLNFPETDGWTPEDRESVKVELERIEGEHRLELRQRERHGRGQVIDGFHIMRRE